METCLKKTATVAKAKALCMALGSAMLRVSLILHAGQTSSHGRGGWSADRLHDVGAGVQMTLEGSRILSVLFLSLERPCSLQFSMPPACRLAPSA